ncbi:MAG TPA: hypothetical protein PKE12_10275 [Kiritimatiellia bacterium]|nr:hypothetical protein [Kiritimatiellia bacterium]
MFFAVPQKIDGPPDRKAIFYSAAVFPGLGQFRQKRIPAATLYAAAGALASTIFIVVLVRHGMDAARITWQAWTYGIDPDEARTAFFPILKSGAFLIGIHLANIYDVVYAWYRHRLVWADMQERGKS